MRRHTSHGTICGTHQSTRFDRVYLLENPISKNCQWNFGGRDIGHRWVCFSSPISKPARHTQHHRNHCWCQSRSTGMYCSVAIRLESIGLGACIKLLLVHYWYLSPWHCYQTLPPFAPVTSCCWNGCTLAIGAISTGIQFTADMSETYRAVQWSLGSLSNVGYQSTYTLLIPVLSLPLYSPRVPWIDCADIWREIFGIKVSILFSSTKHLLFAAIGVGTCVAQCGPIAFVGLVVPHIIRLTLGHSGKKALIWSPFIGGTFLVLCDSIARIVVSGSESRRCCHSGSGCSHVDRTDLDEPNSPLTSKSEKDGQAHPSVNLYTLQRKLFAGVVSSSGGSDITRRHCRRPNTPVAPSVIVYC